jgi:DNA-binding IclR family transcriptional regulator
VREGLHDIAGSLQRNPDAVMWLLRLKQRDEYSFDHAMDVAGTWCWSAPISAGATSACSISA